MSAEGQRPDLTPPVPSSASAPAPLAPLELTALEFVEPGASCRLDGTCD